MKIKLNVIIVGGNRALPSTWYEILDAESNSFWIGLIVATIFNLIPCLFYWLPNYVNNYLHWGTFGTWCLFLMQGCIFFIYRSNHVKDHAALDCLTQRNYGKYYPSNC